MSCNLDHVLYGKLNSTDDMKKKDSQNFAKKYRDDISDLYDLFLNQFFLL